MKLSIVIPVFNEEGNILLFIKELDETLSSITEEVEFVVVNDGSSDKTEIEIKSAITEISEIKLINNEKNIGQGLSLHRGVSAAKFDLIMTVDGDRQVFCSDVKAFAKLYQEMQVDFICSARSTREDIFFKHLPSLFGNALIRKLFQVDFRDVGSSLKIFKKKDFLQITPFRNYHRYISIYLEAQKLSYREIEIENKKRTVGHSKYNASKFFKVLLELYLVKKEIRKFKKEST